MNKKVEINPFIGATYLLAAFFAGGAFVAWALMPKGK